MARHLAGGGGALLVTLTVRHRERDALAPRLALLAVALNATLKGSGWDRRHRRLGYLGSIRAIEVTYGANGWHPHVHVLILFERTPSEVEVTDLRDWLYGRWSHVVEAAGFGTVTRDRGVDVRRVGTSGEDAQVLADYLVKVEGKRGGQSWSIGKELTRGDLKRGGDGLVPFELLAEFVATGDIEAANLWREYEAATFGRQSLRWSPGLKNWLGVVEVSDVEAAAAEGTDSAIYFRWLIQAALWRAAVNGRRIGQVLDECEREAARRFAHADEAGVALVPLENGDATDWVGDPP